HSVYPRPVSLCQRPTVRSPTPCYFLFFHATPTPEIYTLSLHDALPICAVPYHWGRFRGLAQELKKPLLKDHLLNNVFFSSCASRSEEHTSELQSRENLVCRLLLEKKKTAI